VREHGTKKKKKKNLEMYDRGRGKREHLASTRQLQGRECNSGRSSNVLGKKQNTGGMERQHEKGHKGGEGGEWGKRGGFLGGKLKKKGGRKKGKRPPHNP